MPPHDYEPGEGHTPAGLGYRWPAEWEPHLATWLAWPHNVETWPGGFEPIPAAFQRLVQTLAQYETVRVLAGGDAVMAEAKRMVGDIPNVELWDIPTDDAWVRDYGPTFLSSPHGAESALVDWHYNAWGGKYPPFDRDNAVPRRIAERLRRRRFAPHLVLEGGAIDGDGQGTVLTTTSCLLNPNRNPEKSRAVGDRFLGDYLGASRVLWLEGAELVGDDTDGHVDQLARFVAPGKVVAAVEHDPADDNYRALQGIAAQLRNMTDSAGRKLHVIPLPMPRPVFFGDRRLPASYCNFYIANGAVIVPQFDDEADATAAGILGELFHDRQMCPLPARDLAWGLGTFHCLTQQEPAAL